MTPKRVIYLLPEEASMLTAHGVKIKTTDEITFDLFIPNNMVSAVSDYNGKSYHDVICTKSGLFLAAICDDTLLTRKELD